MPDEPESQVINIEAPGSNGPEGTDPGTTVAAGVAVEAAAESTNAATVSVAAAEASVDGAEQSAASAEISTNAAGVSVEAAQQSQMTLQGLADLIEKLPERFAQMNQAQQPVEPVVEEAPKPEPPKKEKPKADKRPEQDHWFFKKRGGKK